MSEQEISDFGFHSADGSIKPESDDKDFSIEGKIEFHPNLVVSVIVEDSGNQSEEEKSNLEEIGN